MDRAESIRWGRVVALLIALTSAVEAGSQLGIYLWAGHRYRSLSSYTWSGYGLVRNNPDLTSPAFTINANGFRNIVSFQREKRTRTLRVLILGGSVMYSGLGRARDRAAGRVDSESTIAQYLERKLRRDPRLADLEIEVINAAVNFNRIVEVASSYLTEYVYWQPDVVIVGGSANNFSYFVARGAYASRAGAMQRRHAWSQDFERAANDKGFLALGERAVLTAETYLASAAVARRAATSILDASFTRIKALAGRLAWPGPGGGRDPDAADWSEYDRYINEYLGYAAAMIAMARQHDQAIAFFWEYLLSNIGDLKPLTTTERRLYLLNRRSTYRLDAAFDFRARDEVASFCRDHGALFLDPLDRLKRHSGSVFIDYLHYTPEGNQFMAAFVYEAIKDVLYQRAARIRQTAGVAAPAGRSARGNGSPVAR